MPPVLKRFCASLSALLVFVSALTACRDTPPASTPSQAWDLANRPAILDLHALSFDELHRPGAQRGAVTEKPWKDSYWPYHRKNIAYRYASATDFTTLDEQRASAAASPGDPFLSPAEKYDLLTTMPGDTSFPLTAESWAIHDYYVAKYPGEPGQWNWMGICAGWAPASIAEPAPRNAVLATTGDGREVLFFAGDVRALLSKAYDINATESGYRVVGSRCNEPDYGIPRDRLGRAVDGRVAATLETFVIVSDFARVNGAVEVTADPLAPDSYWLLAEAPLTTLSGPAKVWRYDSRESLAQDLSAGTRGAHAASPETIDVTFYKSCRDVNPATLHAALVQSISDAAETKSGFVVEISRGREVWNHPVWGFTSEVSSARRIAAEPAASRVFRAPGATHVVDVSTQLVYVSGAQPQIAYPGDDGSALDWRSFDARPWMYSRLELKYTLELDQGGLVVGGEWNEDPTARLALPDFFWRTYGRLTDKRKNGDDSPLKYSILSKLAACSRQPPNETRQMPSAGAIGGAQTIGVVSCPL